MANNKNTLTTIPLQAKLNLNKNQVVVSSDYDQLNKQTAPIYGGCLSPLYSLQNDSRLSLYDKHGDGWRYENGQILRKKAGSTTEEVILDGGKYFFEDVELKDFPYPMDQAIVSNVSYNWYPSENTFGVAADITYGYIKSNNLYWGKVRASIYKGTDGEVKEVRYTHTVEPTAVAYRCIQFRLVDNWTEAATPQPALLYVQRTANAEYQFLLTIRYINGTSLSGNPSFYNWSFNLQRPDERNKYSNVTLDIDTIVGGSSFVQSHSDETLQIIISAPIRVRNYYNLTTPSYMNVRGITVLNKKQNGNNAHKHLSFANTYIAMNLDFNTHYSLGVGPRNLLVQPAARFWAFEWDKWTDGKPTTDGSIKERYFNQQGLGIFCDDSTYIYMATTYHDKVNADGSEDEDYLAVAADLSGDGTDVATISDYEYEGVYVLYPSGDQHASCVIPRSDNADWSDDHIGYGSKCILPSLVTNQRHHRFVLAGTNSYKQSVYGYWNAFMVDNMTGTRCSFYPGVTSAMSLPDSDTKSWDSTNKDDKSIWYRRDEIDNGIYNLQGSMANIRGTNWRVLFNYKEGFISGISYATDANNIGTLLTQWDVVDDNFFITASTETLCYKNTRTGNVHLILRKTNSSLPTIAYYDLNKLQIVADRYVVWNTDAYWNCYDIEEDKVGHWASDWNNRAISGMSVSFNMGTLSEHTIQYNARKNKSETRVTYYRDCYVFKGNYQDHVGAVHYNANASEASGVDVAYQAQKTFAPSRLLPYNSYQKMVYGEEQAVGTGVPTYSSGLNRVSNQKVDFFYSSGTTSPAYKSSFGSIMTDRPERGVISNEVAMDGQLAGTTYPITSSGTALYNMPITGIQFINSFQGKFGVKLYNKGYSIQYDGTRPVGLYNSTSMVDDIEEFFIIQSQYYAVVNDYICAISYSSSNVLNGIEQIVNINGMQFIGAFPSCAYFYSSAARSIFAFTGDADLQLFCQSDKITEVYTWLYAPNNEWIHIFTNDGMYVITQQNVFKLDNLINSMTFDSSVWRAFATDLNYNIIESKSGNSFKVSISETTWDNNRVTVETLFFGPGDMKQEVIDTWYVRFYRGNANKAVTVTWNVKTLTDKVTKGPTETITITEDMWDEFDSYTHRFQPTWQMAQGSSFYINSPVPIAYIGFSHQLDNTTTTAPNNTAKVLPNLVI